MFGIGETELLIIVAFGFMIFGPDKLPGMGRTLGRALRQFRQAQEGFTEVVQTEVMDPLQEAMGDPLDTGTRKQRRASAEERAAALAQDADIDAPEGEATARKETFAERKARLAAERKAREEQEAAAVAQAQAADADAPVEEEVEVAEPEEPVATKPDTSAAALYAVGGRSSFRAAKEQAAAEAAEAEAAAAAAKAEADAPADEDATPSGEDAPERQALASDTADTTDDKEVGSTEA